jgi:hypothetical protein
MKGLFWTKRVEAAGGFVVVKELDERFLAAAWWL